MTLLSRVLMAALLLSSIAARAEDDAAPYAPRRAADERLLLTPTEQTIPRLRVAVTDDELALARVAMGVSDRVQIDTFLGGIPGAGAGVLPFGGLAVGAGAGLIGAVDVGVKVKLIDEGVLLPGLAVSYDMLDVFAAGIGVGAGVGGGGGAVGVGAAGVNAQFNLLSAVAGKHFGDTHVTFGARLLDNHHFLPQSAGIAAGGAGSGGAAAGGGSQKLGRFPTQTQIFAGAEQVLGPHSALMGEVFPGIDGGRWSGDLGVRWLIGFQDVPVIKHVRIRLDLGALIVDASTEQNGRAVGMLPWLGFGLYVI